VSDEYPKVIQTGGIKVTVKDADDEARWLAKVPPAQMPPAVVAPEPVADPEPAAEPVKTTKKKTKKKM